MWDELVCPEDAGRFEHAPGWLSCVRCGRGYPIVDGIPHVFPADDPPHWRAAQQARLDASAMAAAEGSVGLYPSHRLGRRVEGWLRPYVRFGSATRLLELGSSGQALLAGFRCGVRYAVDPLAGALASYGLLRTGPVRWVAGSAEHLPLVSGAFDAVLLCGALEQAADPPHMLAETRRVLAPHGVVWLEVGLAARAVWGRGDDCAVRVSAASGRLWAFSAAGVRRMIADAGLVAVQRIVGPLHEAQGLGGSASDASGTALEVTRKAYYLVLRSGRSAAAGRAAA